MDDSWVPVGTLCLNCNKTPRDVEGKYNEIIENEKDSSLEEKQSENEIVKSGILRKVPSEALCINCKGAFKAKKKKVEQKYYKCTACSCILNYGPTIIESHVNGKKHKANLRLRKEEQFNLPQVPGQMGIQGSEGAARSPPSNILGSGGPASGPSGPPVSSTGRGGSNILLHRAHPPGHSGMTSGPPGGPPGGPGFHMQYGYPQGPQGPYPQGYPPQGYPPHAGKIKNVLWRNPKAAPY